MDYGFDSTDDAGNSASGQAGRPCAVCGAVMEPWRPCRQKHCSDPFRTSAAEEQQAKRPKGAARAPRPKQTFTPGTPPVPGLSRIREVRGDPYWSPVLADAERATGGEPCRICGEPVSRSAHWECHDRRVCSGRCNTTLKRRTKARIERGEIDLATIPDRGDRSSADADQRARF
ncbi:hypothetical protein [Streptomyces griseus]|uniref:hypothetical protein n=1 Tax=Streptomyces griseus TaxID=1911 RepID=UPI003690E642